jgi:hypothetical protein
LKTKLPPVARLLFAISSSNSKPQTARFSCGVAFVSDNNARCLIRSWTLSEVRRHRCQQRALRINVPISLIGMLKGFAKRTLLLLEPVFLITVPVAEVIICIQEIPRKASSAPGPDD